MSLEVIPLIPEPLFSLAVAMADEGVPVRAIARVVKHPSDEVRAALEEAVIDGKIVEVPRDDWPPHARRMERIPSNGAAFTDAQLSVYCRRLFKLTELEATVLVPLLKRDEAPKASLHAAIQAGRAARAHAATDETDPKMVDVVVHKVRRKLKPFGIEIMTMWAKGYFMERAARKLAYAKINEYLAGEPNPEAPEPDAHVEEPAVQ